MRRRPAPSVPGVRRASDARREPASPDAPRWRFPEVAGRLVELSAKPGPTAALTLSMALARDAQRRGETAAWIGPEASLFFPPDAARAGLDLAAFPVVRTPAALPDVPRTAERLARSGAFGLVLLDLTDAGPRVRVPPALLNRLAALARKHDMAVVCLTEKSDDAPSLGPLVSLRAAARRRAAAPGEGGCLAVLGVLRDRRRPGRWEDVLPCEAPAGVEALLPRPGIRDGS
jgi:recombination protein RecA